MEVQAGRDAKLRCAERSLLAALRESDLKTAAALLRCAARYLEGAADAPFARPFPALLSR